jgi:hypothetical protein
LELAILLQVCGNFGQQAPDSELFPRGHPSHQPLFQGVCVPPALAEQHGDAVFAEASAQFSEKELAYLSSAIASINVWNRLGVAYRWTPPARQKAVDAAAS